MKIKSGNSVVVTRSLFQEKIGGSIPTSPHQLEIDEIDVKTACNLNELWHSRLPKIDWSNVVRNKYSVCYWATYNGRCFAVGIWSSPVARALNQDEILELRRLAIASDAPKNTATRMLRIMRKLVFNKFPKIKTLISYQDTSVHKGTIYKADNWNIGGKKKFAEWNNSSRRRKSQIATGDKIRWEYSLIKE